MSPGLLGLERQVCIVMTGEEEGSGVVPVYMRLVPAAAGSGAQSDCSTSSPIIFTGLARLLDYISRVRFAHRRSS